MFLLSLCKDQQDRIKAPCFASGFVSKAASRQASKRSARSPTVAYDPQGDGAAAGYGYGDGAAAGYGYGDGVAAGYGYGDGAAAGYGYGDGAAAVADMVMDTDHMVVEEVFQEKAVMTMVQQHHLLEIYIP